MSDRLARGVKILDDMKYSPLFAPVPLDTWKSEFILVLYYNPVVLGVL